MPLSPFQVYITGKSSSPRTKIALDDLLLVKNASCLRLPETVSVEAPRSEVLWSCYFDQGTCDMEFSGRAKWTRTIEANTTQHSHGNKLLKAGLEEMIMIMDDLSMVDVVGVMSVVINDDNNNITILLWYCLLSFSFMPCFISFLHFSCTFRVPSRSLIFSRSVLSSGGGNTG